MQQKIEENRRENFENDTCIPIIALGAASYFFIKQGKAQGVCGLTLRMVEEAMMGTFTEDLKCSYIQTSIDICKRHLCFYMKTEKGQCFYWSIKKWLSIDYKMMGIWGMICKSE